jgi:hypothetical protein
MAALRRAQQVAAQDVQALDVLLVERHAEHAVLELLHLLVHGAHDRRVVVDDEVEDGMQDVVLAVGQHRRAGFAARTHGGIGGGGAVAHGHDVAAPTKTCASPKAMRPSRSCAVRATMKMPSP